MKWLKNIFKRKHKYTCPCCGHKIKYTADTRPTIMRVIQHDLALSFIFKILHDIHWDTVDSEEKDRQTWEITERLLEDIYLKYISMIRSPRSIYEMVKEEEEEKKH